MKTMYYNKCRVCGTTLVTSSKLIACEACGSDDIYCKKHKVSSKPAESVSESEEDAVAAAAVEQAEAARAEENAAFMKKAAFIVKALAAAAVAIGAACLLKMLIGV